jgi:hypothetical protein
MANWEGDLKTGEDFEQRVIERLKGKYDLEKMEGNFPQYDLKCRKTGLTIECKTDSKMEETGNIIIESKALDKCIAHIFLYENRTTGKIYYSEWPDLVYWLRIAIELGFYKEREVGENRTMGYIIPKTDTIAYMKGW